MGEFSDDTCFLFAEPGFVTGLASVMDLGGSLLTYNVSPSGAEADRRALASDWAVVGSDLLNATETLGEEAEIKAAA